MISAEMIKWYKYNNHDEGTCGLIWKKNCPRHKCVNHVGGYTDCLKCEDNDVVYMSSDSSSLEIIKPKKKEKYGGKLLWITINPPDQKDGQKKFINKIKKMWWGKNAIIKGWMAFEWGGTECTRECKGIHLHMLIREGDHRRIKHWIKRRFKTEYDGGWVIKYDKIKKKKVYKNVCIDFKLISKEWATDKMNYVGGYTDCAENDVKKLNDKKMRKKWLLKDIFLKNMDIDTNEDCVNSVSQGVTV